MTVSQRKGLPPPRLTRRTWEDAAPELERWLQRLAGTGEGIPSGFLDSTPATVEAGDSGDGGTAASGWAAADHEHPVSTAAAGGLGNASTEGTSTSLARADHVHKRDVRVMSGGADVGTRNAVNLVGATVVDNPGSDRVDVTITAVGALDDLTDVNAPAPGGGDVLAFNAVAGEWQNSPAGAPGAHAVTHESGGVDAIKLDNLAAPDDNTDLDVSTAKHGLMAKLPNKRNQLVDGVGAWTSFPEPLVDNFSLDSYPAAPNAMDDEFEGGGALDAKWTLSNDPGGGDTPNQTSYPGVLWCGIGEFGGPTTFSGYIRLHQAPPAGNPAQTYIAKASLATTGITANVGEYASISLYIGNLANQQFVAATLQITDDLETNFCSLVTAHKDNGAGSPTAFATRYAQSLTPGPWVWLKLERTTANLWTAANTYNVYYSLNGIVWWQIGTESYTFTAAPDEIGLFFRNSVSVAGTAWSAGAVDSFRRTV